VPESGRLYAEARRPQFHFTSRRGWLNDPNGLVWFEGEYHLFYQHNPYGWDWGNMHWGHAVSRDLVHWTELPIALYPREYGDWCFSGSAVVDRHNTSGFGSAGAPPLVAAFTSTARGECIVFSNDRGRTWTEYDGNPVIRHAGRDPRLLWHEPTKRWVMAVYDETAGARSIAFHSSPDLKKWSFESRIDGFFECPELFELEVSGGDKPRRLWVLYAADGEYQLGNFDGHRFLPETGKIRLWHGNFYASQTFSDTPDGRRIQIGWGQGITFPGESFNQQMTVPCELLLRHTSDGARLFARPVSELTVLRGKEHVFDGLTLKRGEQVLAGPAGDLLEVMVEAEIADTAAFTLNVRGTKVVFDSSKKSLSCGDISAPLAPDGQVVRLRVLLDRGSIEVFGNDGRVAISRALDSKAVRPGLSLTVPAARPPIKFRSVRVHELSSAWEKKGSLVIVGGGGMPDAVRDKFMTLAGGNNARLVIIPTASSAADNKSDEAGYLEPWQKYSPASVTLLHTRSRDQADDPAFVRPLAQATAVWFGGGDQTALVAPYRGAAVERELKNLLGRGGVIGGTSAGAAVMSDVMIEGGNPTAKIGRGFGFIRSAVFDQHFLRRNRINRLLGVLADQPGLIGLGIDEGTAFVLEEERWSVVGRSFVIACEMGKEGKPLRFESFGDGDHGRFYPTGLPTRRATD
jgi:fructan beta-fructosidase